MPRLPLRPILCAAALGLPVPVHSGSTHPGRVLLGTSRPVSLAAGATPVRWLARSHVQVVSVPDVPAALATYRSMPGVAWVEADQRVHIASAPNDPGYPAQWTLHPAAAEPWGLNWEPVYPGLQGSGALVAVVDTGYTPGGPDQALHLRADLARNFVTGSHDATDDNGHGTFTTNEIVEATNNSIGMAGVAPAASIVPIKALDSTGGGDLSTVAAAIDYAASVGAQVINLSLAGPSSNALCAAVAAASASAVVVAAAGNDSTAQSVAPVDYQAACPGATAVGSVARDGSRPAYANAGCFLTVTAPGGDELNWSGPPSAPPDAVVQETFDPSTKSFALFAEVGTSMASAQVAGEAALLSGLGATPGQARRLIVGNVRVPGGNGFDPRFGAGAVDVAAAVAALQSGLVTPPPIRGYRAVTAAGNVTALDGPCEAGWEGSLLEAPPHPIVAMASTPTGAGYWLAGTDGSISSFGDARPFGSVAGVTLYRPIVGMAATPSGHGYWLVASDGGIFAFGDATFHGSTGNLVLNRPVVGMATTPSGAGYWMVASDGGIFAFGDARFFGSTGAITLVKPIAGMVATSDSRGYALVASDGGVFTFGDAPFYRAAPGSGSPVVAIATEPWPGL